jgi:hypothetical protein
MRKVLNIIVALVCAGIAVRAIGVDWVTFSLALLACVASIVNGVSKND